MNPSSFEDTIMMLRDAQDWRSLSLADPAARASFLQWIRESPAAVSAFLMDTMLTIELTALDANRQLDLDRLIAAAIEEAARQPR